MMESYPVIKKRLFAVPIAIGIADITADFADYLYVIYCISEISEK